MLLFRYVGLALQFSCFLFRCFLTTVRISSSPTATASSSKSLPTPLPQSSQNPSTPNYPSPTSIISHPVAPPYTLTDTGTVLDNQFLIQLLPALPFLTTAPAVTVFAIQNSGLHDGMLQIAQYVVVGEVVYSTDLNVGRVLMNGAGGVLVVGDDGEGGVRVNGSRVVREDVLVENGVVHLIDRYVCCLLLD